MSRNDGMEFMDIDGPEFIADVNDQIASIRASYSGSHQKNDIKASAILRCTTNEQQSVLESFQEICILDTNFLLSKLGYLDTILDLAEENPGSLLVLLPWVVIRELDGLKQGNPDISAGARKAMRFIEMRLREKTISLRGQKMNEVWSEDMLKNEDIKGDDRILDCCLYFQQLTQKRVTLLSNDRNLCIKVMVHDVDSISAESVPKMEGLLNRIGKASAAISLNKVLSRSTNQWNHQRQQQHPAAPTASASGEDYIMEVDDFYPPALLQQYQQQQPQRYQQQQQRNIMDEDYDMMIDDGVVGNDGKTALQPGGTQESKWAKATSSHRTYRNTTSTPAYLNNDPTLTAPKRPYRPQHTTT
ncbi:PIN domain-containing protein [Parasitella parasitica]|nr:PIN domain-containing protein [Parasitella parasitica]